MPVPVFLSTTLDSSEKILAAVEELRGKVPSNPVETELLNMSEMVPEHDGKAEASDVTSEFPAEFLTLWLGGLYVRGCESREGLLVVVFVFYCFRERLSTTMLLLGSYVKLKSKLFKHFQRSF